MILSERIRDGSIPSTSTMENLQFNFDKIVPEEGKILDPQPPRYSDCIEDEDNNGHFSFHVGNEMEGHYCVLEVETDNLEIEPQFDDDKELWVWRKLSDETIYNRNWWSDFLKRVNGV